MNTFAMISQVGAFDSHSNVEHVRDGSKCLLQFHAIRSKRWAVLRTSLDVLRTGQGLSSRKI